MRYGLSLFCLPLLHVFASGHTVFFQSHTVSYIAVFLLVSILPGINSEKSVNIRSCNDQVDGFITFKQYLNLLDVIFIRLFVGVLSEIIFLSWKERYEIKLLYLFAYSKCDANIQRLFPRVI